MRNRKPQVELRVPGKGDTRSLTAFASEDGDRRPFSPDLSPTDTYANLSKADPEQLIQSLRSDKQALKEALRTAIGKRDELGTKVQTLQSALALETKRVQHFRLELSHSEKVISELSRELQDRAALQQHLQAEVDSLRMQDQRKHRRCQSEVAGQELQHEIGKYGNFAGAKLGEVPELQALFRGRARSVKYFGEVVERGNYAQGFLTLLQFICDVLVFETHRRKGSCSPKDSFAFQSTPSSNPRSTEESTDSSKRQAPLFSLASRRFPKESRSAENSPRRRKGKDSTADLAEESFGAKP